MNRRQRPDRRGRQSKVDKGHHVVCPTPADRICEDATQDQAERIPEREPNPIHRKRNVAPPALGKRLCDERHGRGQARRNRDADGGAEENDLDPRLGQADGDGEDDAEVAPRQPHELCAHYVGDGAKDEEEAAGGEVVDGGGPEDEALVETDVLGYAREGGDEDAGAHCIEEVYAREGDDYGDALGYGDVAGWETLRGFWFCRC